MIATTTNSIEGCEVIEYFNPISTSVIVGTNIFSDISAALTDFFGGRSGSYEKRLNDIYDQGINTLLGKARAMKCNAVIGLKIDFGEISGKGTQMFMVSVIGTPVKIRPKGGDAVMRNNIKESIEGGFIESKITARKLLDRFVDENYSLVRLSDDDIKFISDSNFPEFIPLVFSIVSNVTPNENFNLDERDQFLSKGRHLASYFENIEKDFLIPAFYDGLLTNKITNHGYKILKEVAKGLELIDYGLMKRLLESNDLTVKKFALSLLGQLKSSYNETDVVHLKEISETLESRFPLIATSHESKGLFNSSTKTKWVCLCGEKNSENTQYCDSCKRDQYGFYSNEAKPKDVSELIKARLEVLGEVINKGA